MKKLRVFGHTEVTVSVAIEVGDDEELDEDEMRHFIQDTFDHCPYYRPGDDYTIVRRQN